MRPLLLSVLMLAAAAAPAADMRWEVVLENGVDLRALPKVMKVFREFETRHPALVGPEIVKKIVFVSPDRALSNCFYCRRLEGGSFGEAACEEFGDRSVVFDLELLKRFEAAYGDFYAGGKAFEAVVFHELLHGWAFENPARHREYLDAASDGRLTEFERSKNKLFKGLWAMERKIMLAGFEARDEERSPEARRRSQEELERNERRLEGLRAKFHLKTRRFNKRHDIPRRDAYDIHAIESEQEWFAYGGEIAFYAKAPADLLTAKELAWWKSLGAELSSASVNR